MTTHPKAASQILFVGPKRICQQVAYVLDVQDYAVTEKLTKQNWEQYQGYQIYVCEFEYQSRPCVKLKDHLINKLNVHYLDDICRLIDERCAVRYQAQTTEPQPTAPTAAQPVAIPVERVSLGKRILRGMQHPLRAAWHVVLRLRYRMQKAAKRHQAAVKRKRRFAMVKRERHRVAARRRQLLREHPKQVRQGHSQHLQGYLQNLKPSELFLYVLRAQPNPKIHCTRIETDIRVSTKCDLYGCCSILVPFGSLLGDRELDEIYHSTYARIVKLSSLNRSYCLCNLTCCKGYCCNENTLPTAQWQTCTFPKSIFLSFDRSCNLCCRACRTKPYVMDHVAHQNVTTVVTKLLRSGWLDQANKLCIAGSGEVFYSPYYRQLLITELKRQQIEILSNGTLFNASNWRLIADKYATIDVTISVDAATAETYQKLRGADFNQLMQNLNMLADLHRQKRICKFDLNFVVQRDNICDMPDFVKLGQTLGVNRIHFQRLNNLGSFTNQEFLERCLIIDNTYLDYDLWCVLQDPIFQDPMVDLSGLQCYIDASEKRYRQRHQQEKRKAEVTLR